MRTVVSANALKAAVAAARSIARKLRDATAARGVATLALSGGNSAQALLAQLARQALDWNRLQVFQVDERLAPAGHPARNLTALAQALVATGRLPAAQLHALPVDDADPAAAARAYEMLLMRHAGDPPVLDVVHLGLGTDGHTASLFPADAAVEVAERTVLVTGEHAGYRRMTLSLPLLSAARHVVWFITGADKHAVLTLLAARGWKAPAGRVARRHAVIYTDRSALEGSGGTGG
jgi:6-phosphogluconolactonase